MLLAGQVFVTYTWLYMKQKLKFRQKLALILNIDCSLGCRAVAGSLSEWMRCQVTNVWIKQWPHSPVLSPAHFEQTTKNDKHSPATKQ